MSKPALSICRTPFARNASKYQEFLTKSFQNSHKNEEEFNALVDEAFFNQPEDFLIGLNVAPSYAEVVQNLSRIPINPPYVRMVASDYLYSGYCAVISYDAIHDFLLEKGEVDVHEEDYTSFTAIFLNVSKILYFYMCILKFYVILREKICQMMETIISNSLWMER